MNQRGHPDAAGSAGSGPPGQPPGGPATGPPAPRVGGLVLLGAEIGIAAGAGFGGWQVVALPVTLLLAVGYTLIMPRWRYRVHRWEVTDEAVYTRAGWISVHWRIAPISRIQTIDSHRWFGERLFGLANVTATTASAAARCTSAGWTGPPPTGCLTS